MLHSLLLKVFNGINIKRTYRLWKELRLGRVKRYRKRRTGTPVPYAATMPNDVWTIDINHDSCMNETKLRILSIVDTFTRECLALEVSTRRKQTRSGLPFADFLPLGRSHEFYEVTMEVSLLPDLQQCSTMKQNGRPGLSNLESLGKTDS